MEPHPCAICLQTVRNPRELSCLHSFCTVCVDEWLNIHNVCPVCIQAQSQQKINRILEHQAQEEPCVDHLYSERRILQQRLQLAEQSVKTKRLNSQSMHSRYSKQDVARMSEALNKLWDSFQIFDSIIEDAGSFSEAVAMMQHMHLELLELEQVLEGRAVASSLEDHYDSWDEHSEEEEWEYHIKTQKLKKKPVKQNPKVVQAKP